MTRIEILSITLAILGVLLIIRLIQQRRLREKYAIVWLFSGFSVLFIALFPEVMLGLTYLLQVEVLLNFILFLAILFLSGISLTLSIIVSRQTERIEILSKEIAFINEKLKRNNLE